MVQSDLVEGVQECQTTLDFMGLDHALQNLLYCYNLAMPKLSTRTVGSRNPIRNSQNSTKVVRRMTPFGSEPAVIVIKPTDHSTDIKCSIDGVKLEVGARNFCAVGHNGAFDNRTEQFRAFLKSKTLETTTYTTQED